MPKPDWIAGSSATLSADKQYRYVLTRRRNAICYDPSERFATFIMFNPSKADGAKNDQSIRKCIGFTQQLDLEVLKVANLFGFRARWPADLRAAADPVGPDNDRFIEDILRTARGPVIAAWGSLAHPRKHERVGVVKALAALAGVQLMCLGKSGSGDPFHPLMQPYDSRLESLLDA